MLEPSAFAKLNLVWGPHRIDCFAAMNNYHLPHYVSWLSDPFALQDGEESQGGDVDSAVLANTPMLARSTPHVGGLADSPVPEIPLFAEGNIRPDDVTTGSSAPRVLHLWKLAREKGVSKDAFEYSLQAYTLNRSGKSAALSAHERTFRWYANWRADGTDTGAIFSVGSILSASVAAMQQGFITEGGVRPFLSAFADINPELAEDATVKKIRKVSKQNQKVIYYLFLKAQLRGRGCALTLSFFPAAKWVEQKDSILRHPCGAGDVRLLRG